jgi:N-acetylglucosamine-6-phosphate deacetylase
MSAAGMPPGRYKLAKLDLEVGPDQIVRQPGKSLFAGSALRPIEAIFRAAQMLAQPWQRLWPHFSIIPSRLMNIPSADFVPGQPAHFCLLRTSPDHRLLDLQTISPITPPPAT